MFRGVIVITIALLALFIIATGFLYFDNKGLEQEIRDLRDSERTVERDGQILDFTKLLIATLLKNEAVDENSRILLEGGVVEINNDTLTSAWNTFVESETEAEAQERLVTLLDTLVDLLDERDNES